MRRTVILGLCLLNLLSSSCGSAASRNAMLQAALVTAAVVGQAVAESAAQDAEREQSRKVHAAARPAPTPWRLVRSMDADCEQDASNSDESDTGDEPSSPQDVSLGKCMVCD